MRRLLTVLATSTAAVALAACGSSGSYGSNGSPATASSGGAAAVAVKNVDGVGNVLVDSSGRALYSPDQEASGKVLCTGACTTFWMPLAAADGTPTAAAGVAQLGVIDRPDGTKQVTAAGKPLYTFTEDSPGEVKGNGFADAFGSQHFTWHAASPVGRRPAGPRPRREPRAPATATEPSVADSHSVRGVVLACGSVRARTTSAGFHRRGSCASGVDGIEVACAA